MMGKRFNVSILLAASTGVVLGCSGGEGPPTGTATTEQSQCGGFENPGALSVACPPRTLSWRYVEATRELTLTILQNFAYCGQDLTPHLEPKEDYFELKIASGPDPMVDCRCLYDLRLTTKLEGVRDMRLEFEGTIVALDLTEAGGHIPLGPNVDPECQAGRGCGDAGVMSAYESCAGSADEGTCIARGGEWTRANCAECDTDSMMCDCPTGDEGCWCSSGEECEGGCYWRPDSPDDWADLTVCEREGKGVCGKWPGGSAVMVEAGECSLAVE